MRKRNKVILVVVGILVLFTGIFTLQVRNVSVSDEGYDYSAESQILDHSIPNASDARPEDGGGQAEPDITGEGEVTKTKSKYEIVADRELVMDLTYIADFISKGKQFILKRQIRALAGDASHVKCLEYQISDPVDMRMEFFLLLDTGEVLKGYYSYYTAETSVERCTLTEEDVYRLREEEKQALEQERQESEREKQEVKRKAEKKESKQKEPKEQEREE